VTKNASSAVAPCSAPSRHWVNGNRVMLYRTRAHCGSSFQLEDNPLRTPRRSTARSFGSAGGRSRTPRRGPTSARGPPTRGRRAPREGSGAR
jgi:hypothetical protein